MLNSLLRFASILLLLVSGCVQRIDVNKYFDRTASFSVSVTDTLKKETTTYVLNPNASKYTRFTNWLESNQDGWQKSPASYIGDIMVKQKGFTLLRLRSRGVMISFPDNSMNSLQYTNNCDKEDFDFLRH